MSSRTFLLSGETRWNRCEKVVADVAMLVLPSMALPFAAPQQLKCSPAQCALKMLHLSAPLIDSSASIQQQSTLDNNQPCCELLVMSCFKSSQQEIHWKKKPTTACWFIFLKHQWINGRSYHVLKVTCLVWKLEEKIHTYGCLSGVSLM